MRSFGSELNRFALAVSAMDDTTWSQFQGLIERYVLEKIGADYFELMLDGVRVAGRPGLQTYWSSTGDKSSDPVFTDDGSYYSMRSYAYHKDQELWITAEDEGVITRNGCKLADKGEALREGFPKYQDAQGLDIPSRTAVITPLKFANRVFGVMTIEHPDYKPWSQEAHEEILLAVLSLARVVSVHQATAEQLSSVTKAFGALQNAVESLNPILDKPKVFVASGSRSDDQVVGLIRAVLAEFSGKIEVNYWKDLSDTGKITNDVAAALGQSKFGIFYTSDKMPNNEDDDQLSYIDNGNVLFEAGMLHALCEDKDLPARGWIPVREDKSLAGEPPFDIAQERMVLVPREDGGAVNEESFKTNLRKIIEPLVA